MIMINSNKFTFIDLFAGIGGIRIAFERAGCKCVFTSEWDEHCQSMYEANFGEKPYGDITVFTIVRMCLLKGATI